MRIDDHPILDFKRGRKVKFNFEGRMIEGYEGEPISAALHDNDIKVYRNSLRHNRPRGFFCAIGHCSSCFMVVNGKPNTMTCITPLEEGMTVERQLGKGELRDN